MCRCDSPCLLLLQAAFEAALIGRCRQHSVLLDAFARIDVKKARAGKKEDQEMILGAVQRADGGCRRLNKIALKEMRRWVNGVLRQMMAQRTQADGRLDVGGHGVELRQVRVVHCFGLAALLEPRPIPMLYLTDALPTPLPRLAGLRHCPGHATGGDSLDVRASAGKQRHGRHGGPTDGLRLARLAVQFPGCGGGALGVCRGEVRGGGQHFLLVRLLLYRPTRNAEAAAGERGAVCGGRTELDTRRKVACGGGATRTHER